MCLYVAFYLVSQNEITICSQYYIYILNPVGEVVQPSG